MRPIRIIIADTSHIFIEAAVRFLSSYSYIEIVGRAYSSQEALEKAQTFHPDLVLLEMKMAEKNGLEVTRLLKAQSDAPKVVIMTYHDIIVNKVSAEEVGADGYISKNKFGKDLLPLIATLFPTSACGSAVQ